MHTKDRGVVLMSVLLIVLLLSSIAVIIGNNYFISLKRASYLEFQSNSLNLFKGMEFLGKKKIRQEISFSEIISKNNSMFVNNIFLEDERGYIFSEIFDASTCFNVNNLVKKNEDTYIPDLKHIEVFKKIMAHLEVDQRDVVQMIDQIIDWIDADNRPRSAGLEDYFYTGPSNTNQQFTDNRMFHSKDELKNIPSFRGETWANLSEYLCAYPINNFKINLNMLSKEDGILLSGLFKDLSLDDANYVLATMPDSGFKNINEIYINYQDVSFGEALVSIDFKSNIYILETTSKVESFEASSSSIIYFKNNNNGYILSRNYNGI
tara:strand:+ start:410 stop:1372 length:963 start_codon:yes stop_codon:yes gene_type:complete